ncbi:MAG: alpha/beta fold hydrolase [Bacteroidota bacterium]
MIDLPPYRPPWWLRGGHRQSVLPTLFRTVEGVDYTRERLELADGDFLDLDWAGEGDRVALVAHGLEGNSERAYVRGMAKALAARGWRVCAWNMRGCSGEPNRLLRAYHSGASEDLDAVVRHVLSGGPKAVAVVGFSLGGNVTLKWLGEQGEAVDPRVVGGVGVSVPVDLAASSVTMEGLSRRIYMLRFLRKLSAKAEDKAARFPEAPDASGVRAMRTFREFDGHFTAPVHGFASADDYWTRASSRQFLPSIRVPTLLLNALDDPFLAPSCFPRPEAEANPCLTLATPRWGGHVGFMTAGDESYAETAAGRFLEAAYAASEARRSAPSSTA